MLYSVFQFNISYFYVLNSYDSCETCLSFQSPQVFNCNGGNLFTRRWRNPWLSLTVVSKKQHIMLGLAITIQSVKFAGTKPLLWNWPTNIPGQLVYRSLLHYSGGQLLKWV